jgi:DNA polymerase-1
MTLTDQAASKINCRQKKPSCEKCAYKDRPLVPPTIAESKIVVIGEAPGQNEVSQKAPFVGESGKLLRKLMDEVGLDSNAVSYMNVVYCHPPNNEVPHKSALKLCPPSFLAMDLYTIKPEVVILAGAVALNHFFPKQKIMERKGTLIVKDGVSYFPVLHPSYCLRNQNFVPILRSDLNKVNLFLKGELYQDREYTLAMDKEQLDAFKVVLLEKEIISVDIETNNNLDPFTPGALITVISFGYAPGKAVCVPLNHPENINIDTQDRCQEFVREILKSKVAKVFHNCTFDLRWLRKFGFEINGVISDTMIMSYLLDENRLSYSLKVLAPEFLTGYQFAPSEKLSELSKYCCEDSDYTLQLYRLFHSKLTTFPKLMDLLYKVIMPFCSVIVDMELTGILIDIDYADKLQEKYTKELGKLNAAVAENYPSSKKVDLGSPKQLSNLLFNRLKFKPIKATKTGFSVDHEVLVKLAEQQNCGLAKYLVSIRKVEKALSTYVIKIPPMVHIDGRLRGGFNIVGTRTGRLSSQNPNMQNIPRDKDIKKMFVAPEGYQILNIDASQAELRVGCSIADEKTMIRAYNEGTDIHALTASKIIGKPLDKVSKADRQAAKGVNFGFIYGSSAEGFMYYAEGSYGLKLSIKECEDFRRKFFLLYSGFLGWYRRTETLLRRQGFIEYPTGRFARFPQAKGLAMMPGDILRKAVNYPVQGSSSDIILFTMVCLRNFLRKSKLEANIIITVHDSIVLEVKNGVEHDITEEISNISKLDIPKYFPWLQVPMLFDIHVGRSWGELQD